jgi:hypothetical protein
VKLWKVTNGYTGNGDVHVIVIASDMWSALNHARRVFKDEADSWAARFGDSQAYESSYWLDLTEEVLCEDVSQPWVSSVMD